LVPSRVAGQDGRVEPVEIRPDDVLPRPWRPSDTDAVHRALQDPMIGLRPGVSAGTERTAALGGRDIAAQVAAHRDLDVVRWYGVMADGVAG
jgi:hypothetical protein